MLKMFAIIFLCCGLFLSSPAQQTLTPSELANQANALSDLSKLGSYRLKALVVVGNGKHEAGGTLTIDRDQENTRQELGFTDYHEVSLIRGNTGYFQRNPDTNFQVLARIRHFDELWWIAIPPGSDAGAVSTAKVSGVQALCFTIRLDKFAHTRHCFDAGTHLLLSSATNVEGGTLETLFLDYKTIEGVHFPGTIRFIDPEQAPFEVRNIIAGKADFGAAQFAPPEGARVSPDCRHMEPARPLKRINPEYPDLARISHIQGDTRLLVTVGADGRTRKVTPLGGHPILLQASSDAVKRWEYQPATCPSGPVEDEIFVTVRFHM